MEGPWSRKGVRSRDLDPGAGVGFEVFGVAGALDYCWVVGEAGADAEFWVGTRGCRTWESESENNEWKDWNHCRDCDAAAK